MDNSAALADYYASIAAAAMDGEHFATAWLQYEQQKSGLIYADYIPTPPEAGLPELLAYRRWWHYYASRIDGFAPALAAHNIGHLRYFRDAERILRVCYELTSHDTGDAARKAARHVEAFSACYLQHKALLHVEKQVISQIGDLSFSERDWQLEARSIMWAVVPAEAFLGALISQPLHPAQLCAIDWHQDSHPNLASAMRVYYGYEAGFAAACHMMQQILPVRDYYHVSDSDLCDILAHEMAECGRNLRHEGIMIETADKAHGIANQIINTHEQPILFALYQQVEQARIKHQFAIGSMMQQLAYLWFDNYEEDEQLRDKDKEALQKLDAPSNEQAIDAGLVILEYFRNLQFGDKSEELGVDKPDEQALETTESSSGSSSGTKKSKVQFDIQEMEFDVTIVEQEKQKMKLSQIFNALRAGQNVRFSSRNQARSFVSASEKIAKQMDIDPGYNQNQIHFNDKGTVQEMHQDVADAMQTRQMVRQAQQQLANQQWVQSHKLHELHDAIAHAPHQTPLHQTPPQQSHGGGAPHGHDVPKQTGGQDAVQQQAVVKQAVRANSKRMAMMKMRANLAKMKGDGQEAANPKQEQQTDKRHDATGHHPVSDKPHPEKEGEKAKHGEEAGDAMKKNLRVQRSLMSDASEIAKPNAPSEKPDKGKDVGR